MDYIQILGFAAAIFTTAANIPQAYKIIKTRSTKDISTVTYSMLFIGLVLWLIYGIVNSDLPIIIANAIASAIAAVILVLKFIPRKILSEINETLISDEDQESYKQS